jgi:hypothetical protein
MVLATLHSWRMSSEKRLCMAPRPSDHASQGCITRGNAPCDRRRSGNGELSLPGPVALAAGRSRRGPTAPHPTSIPSGHLEAWDRAPGRCAHVPPPDERLPSRCGSWRPTGRRRQTGRSSCPLFGNKEKPDATPQPRVMASGFFIPRLSRARPGPPSPSSACQDHRPSVQDALPKRYSKTSPILCPVDDPEFAEMPAPLPRCLVPIHVY